MENPKFEGISIDQEAEIQDMILDMQFPWLSNLDVNDSIRDEIHHRLALVTGKILDAVLYPERLKKIKEEYEQS